MLSKGEVFRSLVNLKKEGVVKTSVFCNKIWKRCKTSVPYLPLEVYKILSLKNNILTL